jgi:hypothetical protein
MALAVTFGDPSALAKLREVVADAAADSKQREAALAVELDKHGEVTRGQAVAVPTGLQCPTAAEDLDHRQGDLLVGRRHPHEDDRSGEVTGIEGLFVGLRPTDRLDHDVSTVPAGEFADGLDGVALP